MGAVRLQNYNTHFPAHSFACEALYCNGCLPDIYTRSQRATGPMAEGVYIRQTMSAHVITAILTLPGMNHASASAKQLNPYIQKINDVAVFIFPPIVFHFGFKT